MRRIFALLFVALAITAGCRAQIQPTGPIYSCPTPVFGQGKTANYTALETTDATVSGTTFKDVTPGVGQFCYIAQAWDGQQPSSPSNVSTVNVPAAKSVSLSWTNACSGSCTFIVSRTAATLVPAPLAPALGGSPTVSQSMSPALREPDIKLVARLD